MNIRRALLAIALLPSVAFAYQEIKLPDPQVNNQGSTGPAGSEVSTQTKTYTTEIGHTGIQGGAYTQTGTVGGSQPGTSEPQAGTNRGSQQTDSKGVVLKKDF